MKYKVKIIGWRPGAEKISLIQKLTELGNLGTLQAKQIKDRVVDKDEQVEVTITSDRNVDGVKEEFLRIGFVVEAELI